MAKDYPRHVRIGDQLQRELAELVRTYIKDVRISSPPTISAVEVNSDLGAAVIYVNTLFDDPEEVSHILNEYAGRLRGQLGKRLKIRAIPTLHFKYDNVQEEAVAITSLINKAVKQDKENPLYSENQSDQQSEQQADSTEENDNDRADKA